MSHFRLSLLVVIFGSVLPRIPAATASVAIPASTIAAWTGDLVDSDPLGLGFDGSSLYFFEEQMVANGDPHWASRALVQCTWPGGVMSVQMTHNTLRAATAQPSAMFTVLDLCCLEEGDVVMALYDSYTSQEYLVVSYNGVSQLLVMGHGAEGAGAIAYDAGTKRLLVLMTAARGAPSPGLACVDLAGSLPATSITMLVPGPSLAAALTSTGTKEWAPVDLTVQSDGDAIIFNSGPNIGSGGDLGSDGDAVRVTRAGDVSLFFDRSLLDGITGDAGTTGYGDAAVAADSSDHICVMAFEDDPGGATVAPEFLARVTPAGTAATMLHTEAQILSELGGSWTDLSFTRRGLVFDNSGNLLWTANGVGIPQGILMISDPAPAELSIFAVE